MSRRSRAAGMLKPPHHISMVSRSGIAMSKPPATPRPYDVAVACTDDTWVDSFFMSTVPMRSSGLFFERQVAQRGELRLVDARIALLTRGENDRVPVLVSLAL